jgi:hypothetical protein
LLGKILRFICFHIVSTTVQNVKCKQEYVDAVVNCFFHFEIYRGSSE